MGDFDPQDFMEVIVVRRTPAPVLAGWLGAMMRILAAALDFRLGILEVKGFGSLTENGTFDGIIGAVERQVSLVCRASTARARARDATQRLSLFGFGGQEADLAVGSLALTKERMDAVDFTEWMMPQSTVFVTHLPRLTNDQFLIFQVYHWKVSFKRPKSILFRSIQKVPAPSSCIWRKRQLNGIRHLAPKKVIPDTETRRR